MGLRDRLRRLVGASNLEFLLHARNYLTGGLVTGLVGFASLPILTRLLTRAEYGTLAVFLSVVAIFSLILELNFRGAIARYYLEKTKDFNEFLLSNLVFLAIASAVGLGLLWIFRDTLGRFFRLDPELFFLAVLCAALRIPWNLSWKLMVAQQRSGRYATLDGARSILQLLVGTAWIFLLSRERHLGQVYATLVVTGHFGVALGAGLLRLARGGALRWKHVRYSLWFGVPLIPHALSGFILADFDRVIIAQIEGQESTALYSVAYDVGKVMSVIVMAMNQSWLPIFVGMRREERYGDIDRLAATYGRYVYFIALVLALFAEEVVTVLADPRYRVALPLVPVVVFSYVFVFLYTLYSNYSFYLRRTWWISAATVIAGSVNVLLNYWAVPIWGYAAAAWTTLASYVLFFAIHHAVARFILRERVVPLAVLMPGLAAAVAVAVGFFLVSSWIHSYWLTLLAIKLPVLGLILWLLLRTRLAAMRREEADARAGGDEGPAGDEDGPTSGGR